MSILELACAPSLEELVEKAVLAPSPDNNQPWQFVASKEHLDVYLDPSRALPSDVNRMFDLMGIGAAIENADIAARQCGFTLEVSTPLACGTTGAEPHPVARLTPVPGGTPDPLHDWLDQRVTNRKLYTARPLAEGVLSRLSAVVSPPGEVQVDWIADRSRIRAFARLIAISDRFRFEYEPFHHEVFRQLRFSAAEAERTRDGLDVRTLELPPGAAAALALLRPWPRMRFLNRTRLGRLLTVPSALSVWRSGALGLLTLPEATTAGFLAGGRAFQRIWLAAQSEHLALQPLGSLPILIAQMEQLGGKNLTPSHQRLAQRLQTRLSALVPSTAGRTLLMVFRVGQAARPAVRALRRKAEDVFVAPTIKLDDRD